MAYSTIANLATGNAISETWVDGVRTNQEHLHARRGYMFVLPALEWDGTTYYPTPNTAHSTVVAVSSRPSATSQYVYFNWWIPYDYASLYSLLVTYIPGTTGTPTLECAAYYRAAFEPWNAHTGNLTEAKSQTAGVLGAWNIASALPNMAGGDYCSVRIRPTAAWPGGNFGAFGLIFVYNRS